mgnify:CR=1 FL=1
MADQRQAKACLELKEHEVSVFLEAADSIAHVSGATFEEFAKGATGSPWLQDQIPYIQDLLAPDLRLQADPIKVFDRQREEANAAKLEVKKTVEAALAEARTKPYGLSPSRLRDTFLLRAFQIHCDCVNGR